MTWRRIAWGTAALAAMAIGVTSTSWSGSPAIAVSHAQVVTDVAADPAVAHGSLPVRVESVARASDPATTRLPFAAAALAIAVAASMSPGWSADRPTRGHRRLRRRVDPASRRGPPLLVAS
jgi:hypothetical protein